VRLPLLSPSHITKSIIARTWALARAKNQAQIANRGGEVQNDAMPQLIRVVTLAMVCFCAAHFAAPQASVRKPAPPVEMRVDINHASLVELLKVPGMTKSWAGRIVRFRPYWTKQDLLEHGVLTSEVYDRIKDYIIARRQP
jgi:DNA uptake protein ComE-like DNA-binding protein